MQQQISCSDWLDTLIDPSQTRRAETAFARLGCENSPDRHNFHFIVTKHPYDCNRPKISFGCRQLYYTNLLWRSAGFVGEYTLRLRFQRETSPNELGNRF